MAQVPSYLRAKGQGRGRGNYSSVMENTHNAAAPGIALFVIPDTCILKMKTDSKGVMKINCMHIYVLIMPVPFSMKYN